MLADLPFSPYLNDDGGLSPDLQQKIGIYAIFDRDQTLRYVGYSRDVYQSLKQHLVRQPEVCWWYKVQTIGRPSRTTLETVKQAWITETGGLSLSPEEEAAWSGAIDVRATMSPAEQMELAALSEVDQIKFLKTLARRLETQILVILANRGVQMELRFNPKLKEKGLLDLK